MRKFALPLFALVAALPSAAQAQYPPNGYNYYNQQPAYRYPTPYPQQYPNYGYYYAPPAASYPANYAPYPAAPVYYPQAQPMPMPAPAVPVSPPVIQQASAQLTQQPAAAPAPVPEPMPQPAAPPAPAKASVAPAVSVAPAQAVADVPTPILPPANPASKVATDSVKDPAPREAIITPRETVIMPREAPVNPNDTGAMPRETVVTPRETVVTPREVVVIPREFVTSPKDAATAPKEAVVQQNKEAVKDLAPVAGETGGSCLAEWCDTTHKHDCHVMVFAEYLYWTVHGADVPYAQAFDGVGPLSVPRGAVGVDSPQYQSGFKFGGGVSLGSGWLVATFTYWDMDRTSSIAAGPMDVLHNFLVFPNTINAAGDSLTAKADYQIQLYMVDLDYKCPIISNDHLSLNWVAGVRYAHLDQDFLNTFQITGTTTVNSTISFDGIGPRIGLEGEYNICHGFYGYCHGLFDVLFGEFRGNYAERNVFTGVVGQTSVTEDRAVPILELEVGAGWQSCDGRIRISAGYYVGAWFNVMTTTSLASGIGNVNFTTNGNNFRDNITFDGFIAKFEFRF